MPAAGHAWWQATRCGGERPDGATISRSTGSDVRHSAVAIGQRGWKRQPLGGLAGLPREPYESALIDGANDWHMFRHITLPLVWPFIMVAIVIRTIDALKVFDTIFVITQGGPGTASETLNIFLYLQAFQFYKIGYASAVVVIFFVIIIMLSLLLLYARQKSKWNA